MAHRSYTDPSGTVWEVWDVVPSRAGNVSEDLAGGWLAFESSGRRLRFYPLPERWQLLRDWQLERLRLAAVPADRTGT